MIRLIAACLALALPILPAAAEAPADAPTPSPGDRGVMRTAIEGTTVDEIPVVFLGTYPDFAGPGYDLHLVRLEGPIAERVGVASGMSGSPVFFDGRLLGALSYRLGSLPTEAVGGVTPIGDMLDIERAGGAGAPAAGIAAPIATPLSAGGLVAPVREWLAERLPDGAFVMAAGGSAADAAPGPLVPGAPFGVQLLRGDLSIAATGTVTWVDGDRVWGFGHPFVGAGSVRFPLVTAEVIHTLADMAGSIKLSNTGPAVGVIENDRATGVAGRTGGVPRMIPVVLDVDGGSYERRRFEFEMIDSRTFSPLLAASAMANALVGDLGFERESTMRLEGRIVFRDREPLPLEGSFAGLAGGGAGIQAAAWLQQTLAALWQSSFEPLVVEGVEVAVSARAEVVSYRLERLRYDRGPLRPGQDLEVVCSLRPYRGEPVERTLSVRLPDDLREGDRLVMAVGPPEQVDRALGRPLASRLATARSTAAVAEALAARGAADRLTAVVYRTAPGVVTDGQAYAGLPPTAARLLGARSRTGEAARLIVEPIAESELRLDGPLSGGLAVRLRFDGELDGVDDEEIE